jgi:hypothetical protein
MTSTTNERKGVLHTKGPWSVHSNGLCIEAPSGNIGLMNLARKDEISKANAAYIVLAVNAHERLVEALREAAHILNVYSTGKDGAAALTAERKARAALSRAESDGVGR